MNKKKSSVRKYLRLTTPSTSPQFRRRFAPVFGNLQNRYANGLLATSPQTVMQMLDKINADERISAAQYKKLFGELPEKDRMPIDRLLQQMSIIEPTVVFEEDVYSEAGFGKGVHYTNKNLIDGIFSPKSRKSFDLADPAAYSRRLPSETLYELLSVPGSVHSALVRMLQIAKTENGSVERITNVDQNALADYANRPQRERLKDAQTLASLIFTYASHPRATVRKKTSDLAYNFTLLFDQPDDVEAMALLSQSLQKALQVVQSDDIAMLAERIELVVKQRQTQKASREESKKASQKEAQQTERDLQNVEYAHVPWASSYKSKKKKA